MKNLDNQTSKFIEQVMSQGGPPLYKLPVAEARAVLDSLQAKPVQKLPVEIEDLTIPTGPNGKLSIRIVRPENEEGPLPVVMYFHGGGWILGNKNTHDRLVREIAWGSHAAVVFVNYTPSPEAKYPQSIEEAYAATKYIAQNGKQMRLDTRYMAVVGDSVGGNMAIATALLAKERGGPKIDYLVVFYPVTDANFNTASYKQFAEGPWLSKAAMEWFWDAYAPNLSDRKKPTASPLQASIEQLRNFPPTLLITDENDVLRDEGEAFGHKLMQADVEVTMMRFLGTCHDFAMLNPLSQTPATQTAIALTCVHLQKVFSEQRSRQRGAA
jgi:acetyl esterase